MNRIYNEDTMRRMNQQHAPFNVYSRGILGQPSMIKRDSRLSDIAAQISRANIERDVKHLSTAYPTRHTFSKFAPAIGEWLTKRLKENGVVKTSFYEFERSGKRLRNIVGEMPGQGPKTILACAHYDSRQENMRDPEALAPGANDNGTGTAVLLEVARILAKRKWTDNFRFVFFTGEEEGLWGSNAYARAVKEKNLDLRFVFNIDQIGYPPPDRALFVDRDEGGKRENNEASAALVERIEELARTVVKVPTRVDPADGSDYMPFEEQGYVIVGLYEAGKDYPQYHSSKDTFDRVDFAYVHDMARLAVVTLASEGGLR